MPELADNNPPSASLLDRYQRAGRAWVAVDWADLPAAYLIAAPVDGGLHVEQVLVHPRYTRQVIDRST